MKLDLSIENSIVPSGRRLSHRPGRARVPGPSRIGTVRSKERANAVLDVAFLKNEKGRVLGPRPFRSA
jgi:hypothetical protein